MVVVPLGAFSEASADLLSLNFYNLSKANLLVLAMLAKWPNLHSLDLSTYRKRDNTNKTKLLEFIVCRFNSYSMCQALCQILLFCFLNLIYNKNNKPSNFP